MLDLVAVAMVAVLPLMVFAINQVKLKKNYLLHKKLMLGLGISLAIAVILFEVEMRLIGWKHLAEQSPYYQTLVPSALTIHLVCSISTVLLLTVTIILALKRFTRTPRPGQHSSLHKRLGKLTTAGLFLTSITGWCFYYLAFIAS